MYRVFWFIMLNIGTILHADDSAQKKQVIELTVKAQEQIAVPMLFVLTAQGNQRDKLIKIADILKKACEFTGELSVTLKEEPLPLHKKDVRVLDEQGFMRVCYITFNDDHSTIEWRLYDPAVSQMIVGKSLKLESDNEYVIAYRLADALWPELVGQEGFFSTKIAYCVKQAPHKINNHEYRHVRHLYICDYDGSNPVCVVDQPTLNIAPRWGQEGKRSCLYYSRCTASNMQLVELDMHGKSRVVLDADGLNMLPSFSPSGNGVAYNNGGNIMVKRRDPVTKKLSYTKITNNAGNNVSPNLLDNGDVIFCADFQTKSPQIYYYHAQTQENERLTNDGYCCCPCFCPRTHTIIYTKLVKGVSQLFIYYCATKKHEQLTFDAGHKDEPSYSPCGNLVVFSVENQGACQIASMHLATKERHYITPKHQQATYPSWSPRYQIFPSFASKR